MTKIACTAIARVGVDLSKRIYQVHAVDRSARVVLARRMSVEQQGQLAVHRLREGFKEERTALINRIRGLLTEFGLVFPQSPEALRSVLADVIEDASHEPPGVARLGLQRAHLHWIDLDVQIAWCDERIAAHVRSDERAKRAARLLGIRPTTASAMDARVGDFSQFANARQFGAWLGLCPARTPPAARAASGASPNAATATCAHR